MLEIETWPHRHTIEYMVYNRLDPFTSWRDDWRAALVASTNLVDTDPTDLIPEWDGGELPVQPAPPQSVEQMLKVMDWVEGKTNQI